MHRAEPMKNSLFNQKAQVDVFEKLDKYVGVLGPVDAMIGVYRSPVI